LAILLLLLHCSVLPQLLLAHTTKPAAFAGLVRYCIPAAVAVTARPAQAAPAATAAVKVGVLSQAAVIEATQGAASPAATAKVAAAVATSEAALAHQPAASTGSAAVARELTGLGWSQVLQSRV
jgi:hypothetical protein